MAPIHTQTFHNRTAIQRKLTDVARFVSRRAWRIFVIFFLTFGSISHSQAQGGYFWSTQERIPDYPAATEEPPYLLADLNRTVHAFNSQPLDLDDSYSATAVFYRQWTPEGGWSTPNDILYDPNGNIDLMGAANDSSGTVHLIFQKNFSDIYYTQSFLPNAGTATSWTEPIYIAGDSSHFRQGLSYFAALATDKTGTNIVVVYSGTRDGNGLYFTSSSDHGKSWSDPYPIFLTSNETTIVSNPKLYYGESGLFHAAWALTKDSGFGDIGYYANFDPTTSEWSKPFALDVSGVQFPSIIENKGEVFVGYYHENVNGNWWRHSSDLGKTWTYPTQFAPNLVGTNGAVSFVVDSSDVLHVFFGERIDSNNHGLWHFIWNGATWSSPESVVRGPQVRDVEGGNGFDPRSARAVIVNGNLALVTWGTDGFAGTNGAWFSYKRLDAPDIPIVRLENPTPLPIASPTQEFLSTAIATIAGITPTSSVFDKSPEFVQNPQTSILFGILPALLLLVGVVVIFYIVQSRSK